MNRVIKKTPSMADQVYRVIVDEICDGTLMPGTHLVQELMADRLGVSRQPIQQAMNRLKADGMVEELGRRGLFVSPLDPGRMRDHYGVRAALDGWAAREAARRAASDPDAAREISMKGSRIVALGRDAATKADVAGLVRHDSDFHFAIYDASGNAMIATAAEPHWRFLRRAMAEVLRKAFTPTDIWDQHEAILNAIVAGDPTMAERLATNHIEGAADRLSRALKP